MSSAEFFLSRPVYSFSKDEQTLSTYYTFSFKIKASQSFPTKFNPLSKNFVPIQAKESHPVSLRVQGNMNVSQTNVRITTATASQLKAHWGLTQPTRRAWGVEQFCFFMNVCVWGGEEVDAGRMSSVILRSRPQTVRHDSFHFPIFMSPGHLPSPPPRLTLNSWLARCRCFFFVFLLYMRTQ